MRVRVAIGVVVAILIAGAIAIAKMRTPSEAPVEDEVIDTRADDDEAAGLRALDAGALDEARVKLAAAYERTDRASVRFLLARAFGEHVMRATITDTGALVSLSPDGALLAIAHDTELVVWTTDPVRRAHVLPIAATAVAWNPKDATQLIVTSAAGAQYYDARGRGSVIEGVPGGITQLAWGTRARAVIADARAVDPASKLALADLSPPRDAVPLAARPLAISATHALVCREACELVSAHGEIEVPIEGPKLAAFADDRVAIATATELVVVDLLGRELARIEGAFDALDLSSDGTRLVTSAASTQIWSAETGALLETIPAPMRAISRDGTWLVTRQEAGLQLWSLALETRSPAQVKTAVTRK